MENSTLIGTDAFKKLIFFFLIGLFTLSAWSQTVTTDKDDYAPGEFVIITGSGWEPGEQVDFTFEETPKPESCVNSHDNFTIADANGNIYYDGFLIKENHLGVHFVLIATGQSSGMVAVTEFTDATWTLTGNHSALCGGVSKVLRFSISQTNNSGGRNSSFSVIFPSGFGLMSPTIISKPLNKNWSIQISGNTVWLFAENNSNSQALANNESIVFDVEVTPTNSVGTYTLSGYATNDYTAIPTNDGQSITPIAGTSPSVLTVIGISPSITISPAAKNIIYGDPNPTYSVEASGDNLTYQWQYNTTALPGTWMNVGTNSNSYTVASPNVSFSGRTYRVVITGTCGTVTSSPVSLTVNKATPTATLAVSNTPQTYTGAGQSATISISASSVPGTVTNIHTGGLATQTNANTYAVTADFVPADAANYNSITALAAGNFVIGKATPTATIAVSNTPQTYTGAGQSATVSISASSVPGTVTNILTGGLATQTNANTFAVTADFIPTDAANYNSLTALAAGNFVIGKADAAIIVTGYSGTYDAIAHGATGTALGVEGETLAGLNLGASFTNVPGGQADWIFTDFTGNYKDDNGSVQIVIGKADAAIIVTGYSGTYDAVAHGATGTALGVEGETLAGLNLGASFTNVPGGQADWIFTDVTGNYKDDNGSVQIVIGKADAAISVTGYSGTYDAIAHGATGTALGVEGETLAGLNLGASFTNVPGGQADWVFTDVTGNYKDDNGSVQIVIGKASTTTVVTINGGPFTYNGSAQTPATVTVIGANLSLTPNATYVNNVNAGTANASYTYGGDANHFGSTDNEDFTINTKAASVTPNQASIVCGQPEPVLTGTLSGFVSSDNISAIYSHTPFNGVGTYVINGLLSPGSKLSNYNITYNTANLNVTPVSIDASASSSPVKLGDPMVFLALIDPIVSDISVNFEVFNDTGNSLGVYNGDSVSGQVNVNGPVLGVGVYKIVATVGSKCNATSVAYIPVFDPNGDFVTGGGWIDSPKGSYVSDAALGGKANFGFVAKYKKGKNEVEGNTEFQFKAGDINFKSNLHESGSLVISGAKATYRGTGTINGVVGYKFVLVAIDGDYNGAKAADRFRIKISSSNGGIVYDNGLNSDENANTSTELGGGSIVIHSAKGNSKSQESTLADKPIIMQDLTPETLELLAVSPNPVVSSSTVRFSVKEDASVLLQLYDYSGRLIETLFNGSAQSYKNYDVDFERKNLMSGIYILKLSTNGHSYDRRLIIQ